MEDIKIGKKLSSETRTIECPANNTRQLCGPNVHRVRLIIGGNFQGPIKFGPTSSNVGLLSGMTIGMNDRPVILRIEDIGTVIQSAWSMFSPGVVGNTTITDVSLFASEASEL
jgi:hypothetical protein